MEFSSELIPGTILKRYKRFLADVEIDTPKGKEIVVSHVANTGSMTSCWAPGWKVLLSYHDNPNRKLKYSLEMTSNGETWIGVNTSLPNKLAHQCFLDGKIKELSSYQWAKPEVKYGQSRIDLLLYNGEEKKFKEATEKCYVEVKNVTLREGKKALFPDAVSTRGQKHLTELIKVKDEGHEAAMLFIIQREDVTSFSPADDIDPEYGRLLRLAKDKGVKILAYGCKLTPEDISLHKKIPIRF
jgi:sugar fermentation stimulation protein A